MNQVHNYDFMRALDENKPAFGMDNSGLENKIIGGIYDYGHNFSTLKSRCEEFINKIRNS